MMNGMGGTEEREQPARDARAEIAARNARLGAVLASKGLSPDQVATRARDRVQPLLEDVLARADRGEDISQLQLVIQRTDPADPAPIYRLTPRVLISRGTRLIPHRSARPARTGNAGGVHLRRALLVHWLVNRLMNPPCRPGFGASTANTTDQPRLCW